MTLRFDPNAAAELEAAAQWYETEQTGLGQAFLLELSRAFATIEESPNTWPAVGSGRRIRRFVVARFPFAVLFQVDALGVVIVAIAHTKRRPFYWRARRSP